jgi:hypothetical protein
MLQVLSVARGLTTFAVSNSISDIANNVKETGQRLQEMRLSHCGIEIQKWLSAPDPSINYNNALKKRYERTGVWFIKGQAFADWKKQPNSFLWLHGTAGCGKTVLSSTVIEHLASGTTPAQVLLYFYFDFNDTNKQTLQNLLRSLVSQLYQAQPDAREPLDQLWQSMRDSNQQLSNQSLEEVLLSMLGKCKDVRIVLDALDESTTRRDLLGWLWDVLGAGCFTGRILVTARREADIESALPGWILPGERISIQQGNVNEDIRAYVVHAVRSSEGLERWHNLPEVQDEIETELAKEADGM